MTQQNSAVKTIVVIGLVTLIMMMTGLFFVNYTSSLVILAGIIIYFPLIKFLKIVGIKKLLFSAFLLVICLPIIMEILFYYYSYMGGPQCPIAYYRIIARPKTLQLDSIQIQELVILNTGFDPLPNWATTYIGGQTGFSLPEREAIIRDRGFLLKEASFQPSVSCSDDVAIELDDFPLNSFYAAYAAQALLKAPYVDTEIIIWKSELRNIRFSYITPPFQVVKPLLTPFIGVYSLNQWLLGIISVLGMLVFSPIAKPVLVEFAQKFIKSKISNPEIQMKEKAKLIISGQGDEKEIEIKIKH